MPKEFLYRGKKLEELKKMEIREFASLLPSREKRSVLRQSESIERFIKRCDNKAKKEKPIRTHLRDLVIVPKLVGLTIHIHNGKEFFKVNIIPEMIGHRLGEFAMTRGKVEHSAPGIGATRSSAFLSVK
jgi:small subunit ribosomal protein S19